MVLFNKFVISFIDWIIFQYRYHKTKNKLYNYRKIAVIGENFCERRNKKLCGENLVIHNNANKEKIIIGKNVILECKINCNKKGSIKIGNYTTIRENSVLNCDKKINIGEYCFIANEVLIQDNDSHPISPSARKKQALENTYKRIDTYEARNAEVIIEDCVWIGTGAIILKGVKIGFGSIVGVGAVVTKDIPEMSLAVGNPAKVVKTIS